MFPETKSKQRLFYAGPGRFVKRETKKGEIELRFVKESEPNLSSLA